MEEYLVLHFAIEPLFRDISNASAKTCIFLFLCVITPQIHQNDAKVYHLVAADGSHMTSILFFPTHHTENSDQLILLASPNACRCSI